MFAEVDLEKFIIKGGRPLVGEIYAGGSKNSALGILAAALMTKCVCTFRNVPDIEDVQLLLDVFESIGVKSKREGSTVKIDARNINNTIIDTEAAKKMRASYYVLGALLARYGEVSIPHPGGCAIGARPIDQHAKGFRALGAEVDDETDNKITVKAKELKGKEIIFDCRSVGATINVMMAATLAEGKTELINVAKEPHIVDAANFLNYMGAKIKGAGTDVIRIEGVKSLGRHDADYSIIPDQIEVGTYMIAAAATGGNVTIKNVIPKHMEVLSGKLMEMGVKVTSNDDEITVAAEKRLDATDIKTAPYPGFPTDLQQPFSVLLAIANGDSKIEETIYENRFRHLDELAKMGASVRIDGKKAYLLGVEELNGTRVEATDLRAGAALVVAGLAAKGMTEVCNVEHIDRGYEAIEEKFINLNADITRVTE